MRKRVWPERGSIVRGSAVRRIDYQKGMLTCSTLPMSLSAHEMADLVTELAPPPQGACVRTADYESRHGQSSTRRRKTSLRIAPV